LDGVLNTLDAILETQSPGSGLRVCVFIPTRDPDVVHQTTDYFGTDSRYGRDRNMSSRCGVVGKAFRAGQAQYDKLPRDVNVIDYLVSAHGFGREEAASMRQDRHSWAAIPVGDKEVVAVIFLDSSNRDFFGNNGCPKRKTLEGATIGVAKFIARL
jgi:hypothetical protein